MNLMKTLISTLLKSMETKSGFIFDGFEIVSPAHMETEKQITIPKKQVFKIVSDRFLLCNIIMGLL